MRVPVTQRLEQPDLLALERDKPAEREIDQECRNQQEDRRQRAAHVVEHIELVVEPGVRGLVLAPVGRPPAVAVEQGIERA